jgi:hypothetical protein
MANWLLQGPRQLGSHRIRVESRAGAERRDIAREQQLLNMLWKH